MEAIATRWEASVTRVETMATRLEAIAISMLKAVTAAGLLPWLPLPRREHLEFCIIVILHDTMRGTHNLADVLSVIPFPNCRIAFFHLDS